MQETPKFAADRMLARLARWLRLLGADTIFDPSIDGAAMLRRARDEGRVLLSRDKRLCTAPEVVFIESNAFRDQIRQVFALHPFDPRKDAFTRCSRCNSPLRAVGREIVRLRVPPFVYASNPKFAECPGCGRLYWGATHPERVIRELDAMGL